MGLLYEVDLKVLWVYVLLIVGNLFMCFYYEDEF